VAFAGINSNLGNSLSQLLLAPDIQPGDDISYQTCKALFLYHPLGQKMTSFPVAMAQSQPRDISIPNSPEEFVRDQFLDQWEKDDADGIIHNVALHARIYGVSSLALLEKDVKPNVALDWDKLATADVSFNVLDPLNTAGSLVLNQNPNSMDFQKHSGISVNGVPYHRSRTITIMNGKPIYIAYSNSAFGFVGRSVYQSCFFPLKSYIQTMRTDDLVAVKSGLIIAKIKQAGSIVNKAMKLFTSRKRELLQDAQTGNVLSIDTDEFIESLNLQNIDGAAQMARKDIIQNIATGADMPALWLNQETFVEGFGEGTEDAKNIARYIDRLRIWLRPLYRFMDRVTQARAWNKDFYAIVQKKFPERYKDVTYEQAFYEWTNSFKATWPETIQEPESEQIKVEETKFKALLEAVKTAAPMVDPANQLRLLQWMQDNFNECVMLFSNPLELDFTELEQFMEEKSAQEEETRNAQMQGLTEQGGGEGSDEGEGEGEGKKEGDAAGGNVTKLPPPKSGLGWG
jgi:hypothetical protein